MAGRGAPNRCARAVSRDVGATEVWWLWNGDRALAARCAMAGGRRRGLCYRRCCCRTHRPGHQADDRSEFEEAGCMAVPAVAWARRRRFGRNSSRCASLAAGRARPCVSVASSCPSEMAQHSRHSRCCWRYRHPRNGQKNRPRRTDRCQVHSSVAASASVSQAAAGLASRGYVRCCRLE